MDTKKSKRGGVMRYSRYAILVSLFLVSCLQSKANSDTIPPARFLNLAPWKITLPINSSGVEQMGTTAISKDSSKLINGYYSKYFYGLPDSGVVFWCPIDGATTTPTAGSNHPRTELTENYQWTMDKPGKLSATLVVNKYPKDSNNIIIGQIHGGGVSNSAAFVMLHITSGNIVAYVKGNLVDNVGTQKSTLLKNVALGAKLDYTISTDGANIIINAASPGATGTGYWKVGTPAAWNGITVRFQAGSYVQATGTDPTDGGQLTFYKLNISHGSFLPVEISDFNATTNKDGDILLNWKTLTDKIGGEFIIERSKDGVGFFAIGSIQVKETSTNEAHYSFTDANPFAGTNYYRLVQIDATGQKQYGMVVAANGEKLVSFSQNLFNYTAIVNYCRSSGEAHLYNAQGKLSAKLGLTKGQNVISLDKIVSGAGIYYLQVDGKTFKLIKP